MKSHTIPAAQNSGPRVFFPSTDINSKDQYFWCNSFYVEQYRVCSHKHSRTQTTGGSFSSHSSRSFPASSPTSQASPRTGIHTTWLSCSSTSPHVSHMLSPSFPPELPLIYPHIFLSQNNTQTKPVFPQYSNSWDAFVLGGNMCSGDYSSIFREGQFPARHNPAHNTPQAEMLYSSFFWALLLSILHIFMQYWSYMSLMTY